MYGIVEITTHHRLDFYFVSIYVNEDYLILEDRTDGKKPLNQVIPLTEITELKRLNSKESEGILFTYQMKQYKFVEYGNQTITIFSQLLERYMLLKVS